MASRFGLPGLPGRALGLPGATGLLGVNSPLLKQLSALLPSPSRSCNHTQALHGVTTTHTHTPHKEAAACVGSGEQML
jgi:hypothetical protein